MGLTTQLGTSLASRLFFTLTLVVVYIWILYPLLLSMLKLFVSHRVRPDSSAPTPSVSIIVAVHNEQETIAGKLRDCLALRYPHDSLEIIVASDASTDRTEEVVNVFSARDSRIRWIGSDSRVGKSGVQNLAGAQARGEIFLFTDAATGMPPGALQTMVNDLADPGVGLVTATVLFGEPETAVEKGQGFYWRYELFLRTAESDLGTLATGSGQALLVRRALFRPLPTCYGDDCIMPLDVRIQGYRVIQNRDAIVFDTMPHSIKGELGARIRMTARNWAGTLSRPAILNPLRFPLTAIGLVSHKLLRWLTPFFLTVICLSNALLALKGEVIILWWLQTGFYLSAFVGWMLVRRQRRAWLFAYPFSFCLANLGFLLGMIKAFRNQKIVAY
jgi:cellulose synthase/poly-beta-1,6-N-acetylglucosamine synthase-like glycosyltransferase